jgi:hypothetical protein
MKKTITVLIIGIFLLSGLGVVASPEQNEKIDYKTVTIGFSPPLLKDEREHITINVKGTNSFLVKPNKPMLPCYEHMFTFPVGTKIKGVTVEKEYIQKIHLSKQIKPVPEPQLYDTSMAKHEIIPPMDTPYPEKTFDYMIGRGIINGESSIIVKVSVYPVVFFPSENEIEWSKHVNIRVEYEPSLEPVSRNEQYVFVIVAPSEFTTPLNSLVTHKNNRGVSTKLVTLSEIYGGVHFPLEGRDDPEKIKYFIKNAYENWGTRYVLLVGGSEEIPVRYTHVYVDYNEGDDEVFLSDLYYADIYTSEGEFSSWDTNQNSVFGEYDWGESHLTDDVDLYPDVYFGRLACVDRQEVEDVVHKIVTYETQEAWTKEWFTTIAVIGGDTIPGPLGDESGVDEGEYVNQAILNTMSGFIPDKIWDSNRRLSGISPSGVDNINNGFTSGCGFVDWAGHGAANVWTTYPHNGSRQSLPTPFGTYYNFQAMNLENGDKLPIVVTGACCVGKFNLLPDCFTWAFVKNPNGGGIASIGPSGLSWGSSGKSTIYYLEGRMQVSFFKAYKQGATTFGEMWAEGIVNYIRPNMDGGHHKTGEQWEPFGDPTLQIAEESQPPVKPSPPEGPASGKTGEELTYTAVTTDPEGDGLYYLFDWGDGTYSEWLGVYQSGEACEATHTWSSSGSFEIRVQARDTEGKISDWSDPLTVTMPRTKSATFPFFTMLYERLPTRFPWLTEFFPSVTKS